MCLIAIYLTTCSAYSNHTIHIHIIYVKGDGSTREDGEEGTGGG